MESYNNKRKSNVKAYKIGTDYIIVEFIGGAETFYKYTYRSCGEHEVELLKSLAEAGEGLNDELSRNGHPDYEKKGKTLSEVM